MQPSMMYPALQAVLNVIIMGVALVILRLVVYDTASVLMEDVFHCLRYFLPMNVYIIADIVLTGPLMML